MQHGSLLKEIIRQHLGPDILRVSHVIRSVAHQEINCRFAVVRNGRYDRAERDACELQRSHEGRRCMTSLESKTTHLRPGIPRIDELDRLKQSDAYREP